MKNTDTATIVSRFFQALEGLKERKIIRGKHTFASRYGIDWRNMHVIEKDNNSGMFEPAWLMYLVRDYNVSAEWLLTGNGELMRNEQKFASFSHPSIIDSVIN